MDEVITCVCGCQSWVIGNAGTRCSKCGYRLDVDDIVAKVGMINDKLDIKRQEVKP